MKTSSQSGIASGKEPQVARIRMYRHGLGDCFLVRFPKSDGSGTFNILIDCGLISVAPKPAEIMGEVVADIGKICANHIDLVIMTHEHWDHASGFSTQQARAGFDKMHVEEVWYAWTEDPDNALGRKLRRERAAKLRGLQLAAMALRSSGTPQGMRRADRVESLLQFFGIGDQAELVEALAVAKSGAPGKTELAFKYLAKRRNVKTQYCYPEKPPISLEGVEGLRVFVLGPPADEGLIKRSAPTRKGAEVYEFAADVGMDENLAAAFERLGGGPSGDADCPFEAGFRIYPEKAGAEVPPPLAGIIANVWNEAGMQWRRIDHDWTSVAEELALNLDSHTNNTCLVVAFELVRSGHVLLFAADAQVGNWLSWQSTRWEVKDPDGSTRSITGPDLLKRTVFYKVGHHGSHNATLRALGLEQMMSEELVAFVPVFKEQAEKNRWHQMPFGPLVKRLDEKTAGRLVFSDRGRNPPSPDELSALSAKDRQEFLNRLVVDELYYEYSFEM